MRTILLTLAILLTFGCASLPKADKWSNGDIYREVAFQTLNVMDFASTQKILGDNPTRAMEANPLIGKNPSRDTLIGVAALTAVGHAVAVHYMPAKWRPWVQYFSILVKAGVVANNYHVSLGLQF